MNIYSECNDWNDGLDVGRNIRSTQSEDVEAADTGIDHGTEHAYDINSDMGRNIHSAQREDLEVADTGTVYGTEQAYTCDTNNPSCMRSNDACTREVTEESSPPQDSRNVHQRDMGSGQIERRHADDATCAAGNKRSADAAWSEESGGNVARKLRFI
jgi:hypothetical protein